MKYHVKDIKKTIDIMYNLLCIMNLPCLTKISTFSFSNLQYLKMEDIRTLNKYTINKHEV